MMQSSLAHLPEHEMIIPDADLLSESTRKASCGLPESSDALL